MIMTDEPSKLISAINLSKKTMRIVKENIIFAIFIKIAVLVLSAVGLSTMWEAVFADVRSFCNCNRKLFKNVKSKNN